MLDALRNTPGNPRCGRRRIGICYSPPILLAFTLFSVIFSGSRLVIFCAKPIDFYLWQQQTISAVEWQLVIMATFV
jgi:hypothetical protein